MTRLDCVFWKQTSLQCNTAQTSVFLCDITQFCLNPNIGSGFRTNVELFCLTTDKSVTCFCGGQSSLCKSCLEVSSLPSGFAEAAQSSQC